MAQGFIVLQADEERNDQEQKQSSRAVVS